MASFEVTIDPNLSGIEATRAMLQMGLGQCEFYEAIGRDSENLQADIRAYKIALGSQGKLAEYHLARKRFEWTPMREVAKQLGWV